MSLCDGYVCDYVELCMYEWGCRSEWELVYDCELEWECETVCVWFSVKESSFSDALLSLIPNTGT